ncbi:hypothetical protein [Rhodococcus sp. NPDC056516]|uniref:hypothetical protein n=1 Tax=Rhodococcus sp. NPDC056516 TaxID=3345847 RepID=UPI00366FBB0C
MNTLVPTTRTVRCAWDHPCFRLYDRRGELLSMLYESDVLKGTRSAGDSLILELSDNRTAIVGLEEMQIFEVLPSAESSAVTDTFVVLSQIVEVLGVQQVLPSFDFQHLVSWDGVEEPATAFMAATAAIMDESIELGLFDFALLVDGLSRTGWAFQAEFGVIEASDVAARLSRKIGRFSSSFAGKESMFAGRSDAPVSTFVDSTWSDPRRVAYGTIDDVASRLQTISDDVENLVTTLHSRVTILWE